MVDGEKAYRVIIVDSAGNVRKTMSRHPDWYEAAGLRPIGDELTTVPVTSVQAVWFQDGRLWALFNILQPAQQFGNAATDIRAWERRYQFVLEAIDPIEGQIVFSKTYQEPPFHSVVSGQNASLFRLLPKDKNARMSIEIIRLMALANSSENTKGVPDAHH
jgi:hypothetical protein